jgi:hypothetical protein
MYKEDIRRELQMNFWLQQYMVLVGKMEENNVWKRVLIMVYKGRGML